MEGILVIFLVRYFGHLPSFTGSSWYEFGMSEVWLLIDEVLEGGMVSSSSG